MKNSPKFSTDHITDNDLANTKYSIEYSNDLMQDPDFIGLNIYNATPRVLDLISKWALKAELKAAKENRFEDAIRYRDILQCKIVFVRKTDEGFDVI
jgi:hypothetical protein